MTMESSLSVKLFFTINFDLRSMRSLHKKKIEKFSRYKKIMTIISNYQTSL